MIEITREHIHHRIHYYAGSSQMRMRKRRRDSDRINYIWLWTRFQEDWVLNLEFKILVYGPSIWYQYMVPVYGTSIWYQNIFIIWYLDQHWKILEIFESKLKVLEPVVEHLVNCNVSENPQNLSIYLDGHLVVSVLCHKVAWNHCIHRQSLLPASI